MPEPASTLVELATEVTDELVDAVARLVPQLSSSAAPITRDDVAAVVAHPGSHLLIARVEGRIAGMLTLCEMRIPTGLRAWIEDVVVDDAARGAGVGAALNRAALAQAKERGAVNVDLTSRPSREAANRLYQRLGFQRRETNVYRYSLEGDGDT